MIDNEQQKGIVMAEKGKETRQLTRLNIGNGFEKDPSGMTRG